MSKVVRVANASGYWGDDPEAFGRQVRGGPIDYLTLDFLAEITMVILQRQRNPALGYAYDFVDMLAPLLSDLSARGVRVVANAGGVNVAACRDRIAAACRDRGVDHQGKTLAQGLLVHELDVPEPVLAATPPDGEG